MMLGCLCCTSQPPGVLFLNDFESEADLDRLRWRCFVAYSLSHRRATHGETCLRMELHPSPYPGLYPIVREKDWSRFRVLCFDVFNPAEESLSVTVRVDDREDDPPYGDRYNQGFLLKPGLNRVRIPLVEMRCSGTRRPIDLTRIHNFCLFVEKPERIHVLFVDGVRLLSSG